MLILDTNVLSEFSRLRPDARVVAWFASQTEELYTTAVNVAELLLGVEVCPPGPRRQAVDAFNDQLIREQFAGRILPFDFSAAEVYAVIAAERRRIGRPVAEADLQIAAIAIDRGAILVTHNVRHFTGYGLDVLDPWAP